MIDRDYLAEFKMLLNGFWDKDLPDIFIYPDDSHLLNFVFSIKGNDGLDLFKTDVDHFSGYIKDFQKIRLRDDSSKGLETVFYHSYKNTNSLRQMGIQNLFLYLGFVYNTLEVKNEFFINKYLCSNYYDKSVSPIFINESYLVENEFYVFDEEIEYRYLVDVFGFKTKEIKMAETESAFLFSLHLDVSNFYSNIYSHYLSRIGGEALNTFGTADNDFLCNYFSFLDRYNQVSNLSETKGITAGPFSSTLCAELLMCEIDKKICETIISNNSVGYIRNVDDMTFYSDSKEKLENILNNVQVLLSNYKLMINENKISIKACAFEYEEDKLDLINQTANMLFKDEELHFNKLDNFKVVINDLLEKNEKSAIKSILSKIKRLINDTNSIDSNGADRAIFFFLKLGLFEKYLGSRCFAIIVKILSLISQDIKEDVLEVIFEKRQFVDSTCSDSIIQIWFYYLIAKHGTKEQKEELANKYIENNQNLNPIVLSILVNKGDGNNKQLFQIIYRELNGKMSGLMYSRFSLLALNIYSVDKYNYYNYVSATPKIFKVLFQ